LGGKREVSDDEKKNKQKIVKSNKSECRVEGGRITRVEAVGE
jgi:hypothetical protein